MNKQEKQLLYDISEVFKIREFNDIDMTIMRFSMRLDDTLKSLISNGYITMDDIIYADIITSEFFGEIKANVGLTELGKNFLLMDKL